MFFLFQDTTEARILSVALPDLAGLSEQPRSFGGSKGNILSSLLFYVNSKIFLLCLSEADLNVDKMLTQAERVG